MICSSPSLSSNSEHMAALGRAHLGARLVVGREFLGRLARRARQKVPVQIGEETSPSRNSASTCAPTGGTAMTAESLPRRHRRRQGSAQTLAVSPSTLGIDQLAATELLGIGVVGDEGAILAVVAVLLLADGCLEGGEFVHHAALSEQPGDGRGRCRERAERRRPSSPVALRHQLELLACSLRA